MKARQAKKIARKWGRGLRLRWSRFTLARALNLWWSRRFKPDRGSSTAW